MSGIVYPSGPQLLRVPATILLPSAATPFNPGAVNPSVEACFDAIKALESYGMYKSTYIGAQPPYTPGTTYVNEGTYKFGTTSQTRLEFETAKTYTRAAHHNAWTDGGTTWTAGFNYAPPTAHYKQIINNANASTEAVVFFFDLPTLCTLKYAKIRIDPDSGHAGVPVTIPRIEVYIGDNTTGAATLIVTADGYNGTGSYADVAEYESEHIIIADLADTVFDAGVNTLFAKFYGEDDGNSLPNPNLVAYIPWIEYERTRLGEEFGALVP
jgi:hypothetical protein